jgi:hypothetical protein
VVAKFENLLEEPNRRRVRNAHIAGFFYGYSQCARLIFIGIVFWIGSEIISRYGETPEMIYTSIWCLFSAVMGAGVSMSNVPSVGKAKASAN